MRPDGRTARVRDVMRTDVPTIAPEATVGEALRCARQRGIRHVVVMEGGSVVGIISDRDLKRVLTADDQRAVARTATAADIMSRSIITVNPNTTIKCACDTMMQEAISALPVVEGGILKGLLTEWDVLALLAKDG